ncbi:MAG: glucose-6-phosphate dehydrogenase [Rhodobacteraceae bacterium]|nr:glucose-6-phosphate dehydrogenase [Paracoccaceae bacterium]
MVLYKIIPVKPFDFVLFGATGDLASREILPALYHRFRVGQMPDNSNVIGVSRAEHSDEHFRNLASSAIKAAPNSEPPDGDSLDRFLRCLSFRRVDANGDEGWDCLAGAVRSDVPAAYYLSVGPSVFENIVCRLREHGFARSEARIVVEKPFGQNLESARRLNTILTSTFDEAQIYRIDHYLGKETVQNLMALRFANALFEPLWNGQYVDHVQITVAEKLGIKGRQDYYDRTGAMRDMVQNHLLQLLCLAAMEPPSRFDPNSVRDEKTKVIKSLEPILPGNVVRGQYFSENSGDGYLDHALSSSSRTESYVALKCTIANWRWSGTPFYLRTGKCLRNRVSEIAVTFKRPPHVIFEGMDGGQENVLAIRLQPNEGITMQITIKEPGPGGMRLASVPLDMSFASSLGQEIGGLTNAYERLIMDVIRGDQTLFMRNDEVEAAWGWTDAAIALWESADNRPVAYEAGSNGPIEADALLHRDNRSWRKLTL